MHPSILIKNPLRRPQWRLDRVVQLVGRRPDPIRPGRYDDHFVRVYWQILLSLAAAGDDMAKLAAVLRENPHVCGAHRLHYSPDLEQRQILEARLLTDETIEEIATRFATAPQVIDYYENLFFHVRDRLQSSDWIQKVILGPCSSYCYHKNGVTADEQRGYVYRLFAYYGGPLALDAAINGLVSTTLPQRDEEVRPWLDDAINLIVKIRATAAAATLHLNQQNMMRLIKLALGKSRPKAETRTNAPNVNFDEWCEEVLEAIGSERAHRGSARPTENKI